MDKPPFPLSEVQIQQIATFKQETVVNNDNWDALIARTTTALNSKSGRQMVVAALDQLDLQHEEDDLESDVENVLAALALKHVVPLPFYDVVAAQVKFRGKANLKALFQEAFTFVSSPERDHVQDEQQCFYCQHMCPITDLYCGSCACGMAKNENTCKACQFTPRQMQPTCEKCGSTSDPATHLATLQAQVAHLQQHLSPNPTPTGPTMEQLQQQLASMQTLLSTIPTPNPIATTPSLHPTPAATSLLPSTQAQRSTQRMQEQQQQAQQQQADPRAQQAAQWLTDLQGLISPHPTSQLPVPPVTHTPPNPNTSQTVSLPNGYQWDRLNNTYTNPTTGASLKNNTFSYTPTPTTPDSTPTWTPDISLTNLRLPNHSLTKPQKKELGLHQFLLRHMHFAIDDPTTTYTLQYTPASHYPQGLAGHPQVIHTLETKIKLLAVADRYAYPTNQGPHADIPLAQQAFETLHSHWHLPLTALFTHTDAFIKLRAQTRQITGTSTTHSLDKTTTKALHQIQRTPPPAPNPNTSSNPPYHPPTPPTIKPTTPYINPHPYPKSQSRGQGGGRGGR